VGIVESKEPTMSHNKNKEGRGQSVAAPDSEWSGVNPRKRGESCALGVAGNPSL